MSVLVTGSAGHLGEALMRTLQQAGTRAIGIDIVDSNFTTHVGSITDRSFVNSLFSPTRTQGVALNYRNENINFTTGFTDGSNAFNTDFNSDSQIYTTIPTPAACSQLDSSPSDNKTKG